MKLSMWIIAKHLKEYNIEVKIKRGADTIKGCRVFTKGLDFKPEYVYIGTAGDILPETKDIDSILLVHNQDTILIHNESFQNILNKLLSIFDLFSTWESNLKKELETTNSLQKMLDLSEDVLENPVYFAGVLGNIIAHSRTCKFDHLKPVWNELTTSGRLPDFIANSRMRNFEKKYVGDWTTQPDIYYMDHDLQYIGSLFEVAEETVMGMVILSNHNDIGPYETKIASILHHFAKESLIKQENYSIMSKQTLLGSILNGEKLEESLFTEYCKKFNIEKPWRIISMRFVATFENRLKENRLEDTIKQLQIPHMVSQHQDMVVVFLSANRIETFLKILFSRIAYKDSLSIGISLPFYFFHDFHGRYKQSQLAISLNSFTSGIFYLEDYSYLFLMSLLNNHVQSLGLEHQALSFLRYYDEKYNADLYNTLYHYLICERNAVKTAQAMFVHRNTMNGRLKKLEELLPDLNLDDFAVREHLLLSYSASKATDDNKTE